MHHKPNARDGGAVARVYVHKRRGWDSNPRYPFGYNGFQDRLFRPLSHLSRLFTPALMNDAQACAKYASDACGYQNGTR